MFELLALLEGQIFCTYIICCTIYDFFFNLFTQNRNLNGWKEHQESDILVLDEKYEMNLYRGNVHLMRIPVVSAVLPVLRIIGFDGR
jgi:hypothetical protein